MSGWVAAASASRVRKRQAGPSLAAGVVGLLRAFSRGVPALCRVGSRPRGGSSHGRGGTVPLGPLEMLSLVSLCVHPLPCETWNVLKIGFQLKQVRERLAKGLVDKGVLRTEKRNFLLFDMATHPVADPAYKAALIARLTALLTASTSAIPPAALHKDESTQCRVTRAVCLACAAYTASVLDNAFGRLGYEEREAAFGRCDEILGEFGVWPFGGGGGELLTPLLFSLPFRRDTSNTGAAAKRRASRIAAGSGNVDLGRESVRGLVQGARAESVGGEEDGGFEVVAAVLEVLSKLDSLL
ncbi:Golgi phosphoprotein 3-domain-containing protein [Mycena rebaudengoi]|nr:Golgi phosphoprotein 3-domain-containing protein [Mycena rebaudengoi]